MQQRHCASEDVHDSEVSKRLTNVEKHVRAMETKAQNDLELVARISGAEHQLLELTASIQEMQVKHTQEVQERKDMLTDRLNVVSELCSLLALNQEKLRAQLHTMNVPDLKNDAAVSATFSAPRQPRRAHAGASGVMTSRSADALTPPRQQWLFPNSDRVQPLNSERMQPLRAEGLPQHQGQFQCQQHTHCPSAKQQRNCRGHDVILPQAMEQTTPICGNHALARGVPSKPKMTSFSAGVSPGMGHLAGRGNFCDRNRKVLSLVNSAQNYRMVNPGPTCTALLSPRHPF